MPRRTFVIALVLCLCHHARADIGTSVYDDAKSIIEDLMTDELSRQVVPRLVCRGRHDQVDRNLALTSDDKNYTLDIGTKRYVLTLLYHYPQTLQRVYTHQFGSVRSALQRESEDWAAFQIYDTLGTSQPTVNSLATAVSTLANDVNTAVLPAQFSGDDFDACVAEVGVRFAMNAFATMRSAPLDALCSSATGTQLLRCEFGLAFRAALQDHTDTARTHLLRAVASVMSDGADTSHVAVLALGIDEVLHAPTINNAALDAHGIEDKYSDAVRALAASWRTINTTSHHLDIATVIDDLSRAGGVLDALCTAKKTDVCQTVDKVRSSFAKAQKLWPLVTAIANGDYRTVAHLVIVMLFDSTDLDCSQVTTFNSFTEACHRVIYKRFADSLVTYFMDTIQDGAASGATRAAFQAAAEDVLRDLAANGGIDRGFSFGHILIPDLELDESWSTNGANNGHLTASIPFVSWRPVLRYTRTFYLALHASIFDPLAPLASIANQSSTATYVNEGKVWWDMISPHVGLVYGLPTFSKHLLVGAGATFHPVVPLTTTAADGSVTVKYVEHGKDGIDDWAKFISFGVFVKYAI